MRTSQVPVLVVGAGPAGAMMVLELARRGVHVRVVDQLARPQSTSRAVRLRAATLELLERIDKRLVARFVDRGLPSSSRVTRRVDAAGRRQVVRSSNERLVGASRYPFDLVHRQSETELYLREYASAHFGVSADWSTTCVGVRQVDGGVVATLMSDGVEEQVHCRFLVACDGADSTVRRLVGLASLQSGALVTAVHQLDAFLDGFPEDDDVVHRCEGPDHRLDVARLPGAFYRLDLYAGAADTAASSLAPERFLVLLNRHFDGVKLREVVGRGLWQSRATDALVLRTGQVFFAGDAACAPSGVDGDGLNAAIEDAFNLGWKLAFAAKGLATPALLATYETERSDEHRSVSSAVAAATGGPPVGQPAPDVDFGRGRSLFDALRHPLCTVLALPGAMEGVGPLRATLRPFAEQFANVLQVRVIDPSAVLAARYGANAADRLLLVRPDGRVAFAGAASELAALEAHLASWVATSAR